jgi:hypothetical protein
MTGVDRAALWQLLRAGALANWERARREEALEAIEPLPYMTPMEEFADVAQVEVVGAYRHRLRLTFADGTVGDVDFSGREWRGVVGPLGDAGYFARVAVETAWRSS